MSKYSCRGTGPGKVTDKSCVPPCRVDSRLLLVLTRYRVVDVANQNLQRCLEIWDPFQFLCKQWAHFKHIFIQHS